MTSLPSEIALLDAGTQIKGWTRTGHAFKAHTTAQAGTLPACRYYIPPATVIRTSFPRRRTNAR
ncbi:MAG: hypothetical protein IPN24_07855 [Betaproteobacteria bacterium]|nr:hypothetical protein [Betaproteobacteria bacterium]